MILIYILAVLLGPLFLLQLNKRFPILDKVGLVVLAYVFGLLLSLFFDNGKEIYVYKDALSSVLVPIAIPLLLLQTNWKEIKHLARSSVFSLLGGILAVCIIVSVGYCIFKESLPNAAKVGGLLVGAYTGGTPNLASLKLMLDVDETTYLATHSTDMIFSTIYLFFFMTIGQRVIDLVLTKSKGRDSVINQISDKRASEAEEIGQIFDRGNRLQSIKMLAIGVVVLGAAFGLSLLFPSQYQTPIIILGITTLGLLGSSICSINDTSILAFETGMYLILSFSIAVASMIQRDTFSNINPVLFAYIGFTVFGGLLLHILFAKIFKVDTDTLIATSTSLVCSPPFVPVVSGALRNRSVLVPGITVGIIGYAIGNYLGFLMSIWLGS